MAGAYDGRGVTAIFKREALWSSPKRDGRTARLSFLIPAGDAPACGDIICAPVGVNAEDAINTIDDILDAMQYGVIVTIDDPPHVRATKLYVWRMNVEDTLTRHTLNCARAASALAKVKRSKPNV